MSQRTRSQVLTTTRDILTRQSFINAITIVNIIGGSTNSVLHLLAMARAADIDLSIDDFQKIADRTPWLVDIKYVRLLSTCIRTLTLLLGHQASTLWKTFTRSAVSPLSSNTS